MCDLIVPLLCTERTQTNFLSSPQKNKNLCYLQLCSSSNKALLSPLVSGRYKRTHSPPEQCVRIRSCHGSDFTTPNSEQLLSTLKHWPVDDYPCRRCTMLVPAVEPDFRRPATRLLKQNCSDWWVNVAKTITLLYTWHPSCPPRSLQWPGNNLMVMKARNICSPPSVGRQCSREGQAVWHEQSRGCSWCQKHDWQESKAELWNCSDNGLSHSTFLAGNKQSAVNVKARRECLFKFSTKFAL